VEHQVEPEEGLQAAAEARARPARSLGDGADATPLGAVEVKDAIGLAEANASQHHRLGLE
jgi:hypothetical protein